MVFFNDEQIRNEVVAKLSTDQRIDASGIRVEVYDGVVKLSGTVPSDVELTRAYADAAMVSGGSNIVDALTVSTSSRRDLTDDGALKVEVGRMLATEPEIDPSRVMVMVQDGRVSLEGSVDADWKKAYVEALVARRPGVEDVTSKLSVVPTKGAADQATADDLIGALERHPLIGSHELVVHVEEGAVTLSGEVASEDAREAAKLLALHIFGVTEVEDEIVIAAVAD
ncbi:MAG: BON domain-containing protein [Thermoanaerobaculales bacterium]|jgi:osmotically-inducible protein OsmY|nr:BON domain-containing protein [Thermoanaerobaculales bacterium]